MPPTLVEEVIPLAVSRQFVTTLWVRLCDLFAVVIQLMNEFNSFLGRALGLVVVLAAEAEAEELPLFS
jgi:hypothetical protein